MKILSLFDGKYDIADDGRIFSNVGKRKELSGKIGKSGYIMICLTINKKKLYPNLHRIIAENFIPNPKNLPEVNHKDGNKLNNSVSNLEWCSRKQNSIHARDNKLQEYKIEMKDALEIRRLYKTKLYSYRKLAKMFCLGKTQIGYIIQNKRWVA